MLTRADITRLAGISGSDLARRLGISRQAVHTWGEIPVEQVLPVYHAIGGRVTPHQMCPRIYPDPDWAPPLDQPVDGTVA